MRDFFNAQRVFYIFVSLAMIGIIIFGVYANSQNQQHSESVSFVSGRVVEIVEDRTAINHVGVRTGTQELRVRLLSGARRGDIIEARNMLFPIENAVYAQVGQRVILFFEQHPNAELDDYFAHVQSDDRTWSIYVIIAAFFGLLALVFGRTGIKSAFSLVFTFVVIIFLLLPLIVGGASPALLTILLSLCIVVVSLIAIMGFGKKTYVSIAGTCIGIVFYGIFYLLISVALGITGFNVQEIDLLIVAGFNASVGELLFCAILIASLGALMDVAVSLASVTAELSETTKNASFKTLYTSAMKIGRDIIGSSSNTLILAFTGTFFITLIVFNINNLPYNVLINRVDIGIEVMRAISASSAMVLCAPATAFIGSRAFAYKK
ncbi:MAG: YibE/F family protein [Defluviitaleaceae bacterium]|nr:YibE/F family protein [Defluviitaleaceae bacterium]